MTGAMVQKIVINRCHGGFGLSIDAVAWMREHNYEAGEQCKLGGEEYEDGSGVVEPFVAPTVPRRDKEFRTSEGLIAVVEELGDRANGEHAELSIVEIPDGVEWELDEYDGVESVEEKHRSWS